MRIRSGICAVLTLLWGVPSALAQTQPSGPANQPSPKDAIELREANDRLIISSPVPVVLELFTSQGCSSCPPADELFATYAQRRNVIALSFPVDYWDHLGWRDTLAGPRNTARQRAYAKALGIGNVYTPQMVINGATQAVGSKPYAIEKAIARTMIDPALAVRVRAHEDGSRTIIEIGARDKANGEPSCTVWLIKLSPRVGVEIKRGENRGKKMEYVNVVREISPIGMWSGKQMRIELPSGVVNEPGHRSAVLVQTGDMGRIIGASWLGRQ